MRWPRNEKFKWHDWYAWRPVFVDDRIVWREWVKRRWHHAYLDLLPGWQYNLPENHYEPPERVTVDYEAVPPDQVCKGIMASIEYEAKLRAGGQDGEGI